MSIVIELNMLHMCRLNMPVSIKCTTLIKIALQNKFINKTYTKHDHKIY